MKIVVKLKLNEYRLNKTGCWLRRSCEAMENVKVKRVKSVKKVEFIKIVKFIGKLQFCDSVREEALVEAEASKIAA